MLQVKNNEDKYNRQTHSGFINISLKSPNIGFGNYTPDYLLNI